MMRKADFVISSNLSKQLPMPDCSKWKICDDDRVEEEDLLVYIRDKGIFFNSVCKPQLRRCVLTKKNYLIIYMKKNSGFVLDLLSVKEVSVQSDYVRVHGRKMRRCRLKLRFAHGTVNISLSDAKIARWRDILISATETSRRPTAPKPILIAPPCPDVVVPPTVEEPIYKNLPMEEPAPSTSTFSPKKKNVRFMEQTSVIDTSTCDDEYQTLRPIVEEPEEEESMVASPTSGLFSEHSIRESRVPVGWLRRQLELKLAAEQQRRAATTPMRAPKFVSPPVVGARQWNMIKEQRYVDVQRETLLRRTPDLLEIPLSSQQTIGRAYWRREDFESVV